METVFMGWISMATSRMSRGSGRCERFCRDDRYLAPLVDDAYWISAAHLCLPGGEGSFYFLV